MKHISTILSVIALALGIFLFVRDSGHKDGGHVTTATTGPSAGQAFRIAYFDMDSLEAHYEHFKDAQTSVKAQENEMNMALQRLNTKNQKQIEEWRQKGNTMTQAEGEQAQQKYQQMQQEFQSQKSSLEQELYKKTEDLKTTIRKEVEDFLKTYNKDNKYSFIFAYDPNSFIYSKDSTYNITPELLRGLNDNYTKGKK